MSATALLLSLSLTYTGMLGFCLGMERHWKQLANPRLPDAARRLCVPFGVVLLTLAGWIAGWIWPSAMAAAAWFGMLSLTGLTLVLLMPYRPRLALCIPLLGLLVAGLSALVSYG